MKIKKTIAIILEIIPVICAPLSIGLILSKFDSPIISSVIAVTMLLGFLGFVFFILGRLLAKEEKAVRILGVLDILATVAVIGFYVLIFFIMAQ